MEAVKLFDDAFEKGRIYVANKAMKECIALAENGDAKAQTACADRSKEFALLKANVTELDSLMFTLENDDDWTMAKETTNDGLPLKVYYQFKDGSNIATTKTYSIIKPQEGVSSAEMLTQACCLFAETDLMQEWFPMGLLETHETLKEITRFSRYTRLRLKMPAFSPFGKREALILAKSYDLTERNAWIITIRELQDGRVENPGPEEYASENLVDEFPDAAKNKSYTRMNIRTVYYMEIRDDGCMIFRQLSMMDLKLKYVPTFIVNTFAKGTLSMELAKALARQLKKFKGSEWEKRRSEKLELYDDIQNRLENTCTAKKASSE